MCFFFFKQKTAYEMRISDWSSDVCSSDLPEQPGPSQLVDRQGHGRRFADREGRATAWGDRRYDDLAALAARQDSRTDRRLTIDLLVGEARRGNSQGRKPVVVQLRHLLPESPLAVLDHRFPRTVDQQLRDILRLQKREERREMGA